VEVKFCEFAENRLTHVLTHVGTGAGDYRQRKKPPGTGGWLENRARKTS